MAKIQEALDVLTSDEPNTKQRGNRFERFIQKAFSEHPGIYGKEKFEKIWLWSEWPQKKDTGLPEVNGIDLVGALTPAMGGGFCAIQCKFWNQKSKIGKVHTSSFLTDMRNSGIPFNQGLFVSTADLSRQAENQLFLSDIPCKFFNTATMDEWVEDWTVYADDFSQMNIPTVEKFGERDYQEAARKKAIAAFDKGEARGQIILPCGTGKMFVSLRLAEDYVGPGKTVLYLVPSIGLVHQTMQEWSEQRSIPIDYLAVCSDPSVAKKEDKDSDVAGRMSEIQVPVTTCEKKIGEWLDKPAVPGTMKAVFSTYHSSDKIRQALENHTSGFRFDMMILDEAHRTSGRKREADSPFVLPLHDENIPSEKRVFFTATPRVFDDQTNDDMENVDTDLRYDMGDESLYGKVLYQKTFAEMIDEGWLSDYEILVITGSREAYRDSFEIKNGKVVWKEQDDVTMDQIIGLVGAWDALSSPDTEFAEEGHMTGGLRDNHLKSAICYTNRTKHSDWIAKNWQDIADKVKTSHARTDATLTLDVSHVEAKTSSADRISAVNELKTSKEKGVCKIISNVQIFSEGVNVPSLDAVIFLSGESSAVDIAQQIGRVMRKTEGKEKGYVIIPVFVPDEEDPDQWFKSSDWNKLYRVIRALKSHDDRMSEYLKHPNLMKKIRVRPIDPNPAPNSDDPKPDTVALPLIYKELSREVASRVVNVCGDKEAYPGWGKYAAKVSANIAAKLESITQEPYATYIEEFKNKLQASVSKYITLEQAREMLSQHIVTIPIFDRMLGDAHFAERNKISIAISETLNKLGLDPKKPFPEETQRLARIYDSMGKVFEAAETPAERLDVLKSVYDGFFAQAMPTTTKELGIVYTPVELVDFVIRSCAAIRHQPRHGRTVDS